MHTSDRLIKEVRKAETKQLQNEAKNNHRVVGETPPLHTHTP